MTTDSAMTDPIELVERWFEDLFNDGDVAVADQILASDVEYHGPVSMSPKDVSGPEDIKEYVEVYKTAFPDLLYDVRDVSEADGEIRVHWRATGTHKSDLFGMDPTGEMFTVEGIDLFTVEDGVITSIHAQWDTLQMVQELGVVPSVGLAADS